MDTLNLRLYKTGQFAKRASVSLRTLRYYDREGLFSPAHRSEAGYRLYADEDLLTLQRILALKFLGFSLDEIRLCLRTGPSRLEGALAQQREMMREKREQLNRIIQAIEETETLLRAGECDWESIARVIQVIKMEQKTDWVQKYFTDEQRQQLEGLSRASYSDAARAKLSERGPWTEEDQKRADADWRYVAEEADRLAGAGAGPAGEAAQALAKYKWDLLAQFTRGDPDVEADLSKFWDGMRALPADQRPFDTATYTPGGPGADLLERAMAIYRERGA